MQEDKPATRDARSARRRDARRSRSGIPRESRPSIPADSPPRPRPSAPEHAAAWPGPFPWWVALPGGAEAVPGGRPPTAPQRIVLYFRILGVAFWTKNCREKPSPGPRARRNGE